MIISSPDSLNGALETSFIRDVLFSNTPFSLSFNLDNFTNTVVIYLELFDINIDFIKYAKSKHKKVVLYHMGDEICNKNKDSYGSCDLVIRNYFFENINSKSFHPNIMWSPNGYRTGVGPRARDFIKPVKSRTVLASFLGWLNNPNSSNNERKVFLSEASQVKDKVFLLETPGFASGYNVGLYSAIIEDSIFSPCPAGNSPETIRLYDSLELGAIPISLKHPFLNSKNALGAIGMPPFPQLENWGQLPNFLNEMEVLSRTQPDKIQGLQTECLNWWQAYKKYISNDIAIRIRSLC